MAPQTSALHADPSCASLTELSRVIRASIQDLTPQAAMTQLGHYKRKEDFPKLLSIASGARLPLNSINVYTRPM